MVPNSASPSARISSVGSVATMIRGTPPALSVSSPSGRSVASSSAARTATSGGTFFASCHGPMMSSAVNHGPPPHR